MWKNFDKNIVLYALGTLIILGILVFNFASSIFNFLGEKSFLELHRNNLAKLILENSPRKNYYTHYLLGRIYFVEGNFSQSLENYNLGILEKTDFKESYYGRGLTLGFTSAQFLDEAEKDFSKYIELDNLEFQKTGQHAYGAWAGYNDLAWIYFLKNDFKKMEKAARAGLQITASNAWLTNMIGVSLLAQGDCKEGYFYLDASLKTLGILDVNRFGEAYSGDDSVFWPSGKRKMEESIKENLKICQAKLF